MLYFYSVYLAPLSVLIPAFFGIKYYKSLTNPFRIIFWFVIFSGLVNAINLMMMFVLYMQTLVVLHFYTIFEFIFISMFYRCFQNKAGRNVINALMVIFALLCLINFVFFQKITSFNTYTRTTGAIIIIGYCVQYFFKQSERDIDSNWASNGLNWLNAGILIYYASGIFFFMTNNYLMLHKSSFITDLLWSIIDTMLLVEYILFAIGFYKCKEHPTTSLS
ncbi:hypothetical protein [Mucilaginibacter sp.]|uniref:hypothetical protein n=1 Tax=Mucilaginibacter sp. TaxID=1882438 RepID=UPI0035BC3A75